MSLNHSPSVVTNGLVFYYDTANTQKSWKGRPVTNQFTLPTTTTNGFGVQSSTFTRVLSGNYGNYDITPSDYVWRYDVNGSDCPYHGWDIPTITGTVVTFSFDYYISPTSVGYPSTNYLANMENTGSGVGGSYVDPTPSIIGVWKRAYFSSTATATGNSRCLMYPGACGGQLANSGFILYKNPQVEFNATGSIPTPFVAGTRSNTQSIIDLTNNNTITANSLTYNSDGSFSFNGSSDYATISTNFSSYISGSNSFAIECWVKPNSSQSAYTDIYGNHGVSGAGASGFVLEQNNTSNNSYYFAYGNGTGYVISSTFSLTANVYNHVVISRTSGYVTSYVNGTLINNDSITTPLTPGPNYTYIGQSGPSGRNFNGVISNFKIYSRNLSTKEVLQNFNALRGRYGI